MSYENFNQNSLENEIWNARMDLLDTLVETRRDDAGALAEKFAKQNHEIRGSYDLLGLPEENPDNPGVHQIIKNKTFRENPYIEKIAKGQEIGLLAENTLSQEFVLDGADGGLALAFEGVPSVNAGFEIVAFDGRPALKIVQLQRVYLSKLNFSRMELPKLEDVRWEKILVAASEQIAKQAGITQMIVQSAKNNKMIKIYEKRREEGDFTQGISLDAGKRRYDTTAKRMGYKLDEDSGDYVKNLGSDESAMV